MALHNINFNEVILDLRKAGSNDKQKISDILYRYRIPKIDSLQRKILEYIFSENFEQRSIHLDILGEANNLPIIKECHSIISSRLDKESYITYRLKKYGGSRISKEKKYDACMRIIDESSFLTEKLNSVKEYTEYASDHLTSTPVIRHRYRNARASRTY